MSSPLSPGRRSSVLSVRRDEQGGHPADEGETTHDHERPEVLAAAGYRAGDQRAGDRDSERGSQVGDAARDAGDVALLALRPGRLDEVDRRGEHDPDAQAHQEQARKEAPEAGPGTAEREQQAETEGGQE